MVGLQYHTTSGNKQSKNLACRHIRARALRGQTLAEYALILAFISVVAIASLITMGGKVTTVYSTTNAQLHSAENGGVSNRH